MSFLYLISPPKIDINTFPHQLEEALSTNKVATFQLRLKDIKDEEIAKIGKELVKICHKYKTPFILNDNFSLALEIGANGVHVGAEDGNIAKIRAQAPEKFIIGTSCYDSKHSAMIAAESGADYLSFGTFFPSQTKNSIGSPTTDILEWCNEVMNLPIVAIGGINANNYKSLMSSGANFIAVISYIWNHERGIKYAIDQFK